MTDTVPESGDPMTEIRALTIRQPWAALIAHDDKRVENRTWGTAWRGQLLIHAAKTADPIERHSDPVTGGEVRSAIVATATLTDCHVCDGRCSLWAEPGRHHWVLTDVRPLAVPVPCRGALGLWRPSPELAAVVDASDDDELLAAYEEHFGVRLLRTVVTARGAV